MAEIQGYFTSAKDSNLSFATISQIGSKFCVEVMTTPLPLTQKRDGSGGRLPIFVGFSPPGTNVASGLWSIQKRFYSGTNFFSDTKWASGNGDFDKIWNDRGSYTYS